MVWNAHLQARGFVEPLCWYDNASSPREWTSYLSSNKCVGPKIFEKTRKGRKLSIHYRLWVRRPQSCCFAQSIPSNSSVSTERSISDLVWRTWSANLGSFVLQHRVTRGEYERCRVNPNESTFDQRSGTGKLVAKSTKDSKHFQRTCKWLVLAKTMNLWQIFLLDSISWQSMIWKIDEKVLDHAENIRFFWSEESLLRKDGSEEIRKLAQSWKSKSRIVCINMELKSDSNPWRMMYYLYRGLILVRKTRCDETEGTIKSTIFSFSMTLVPVDPRLWKDILAVVHVDEGSLSFSVLKTMTRILRHRGFHREDDGAMDHDTLLHNLCRDCENAPRTNF